jgi:hypothetical protein
MDEPKNSKNPIFKHFMCMLNRTKRFDASTVLNITHLTVCGGKIISRHFQLVIIAYQKLNFHEISRFSAVVNNNNLKSMRYKSEPWIQKIDLGFLLTGYSFEKKNCS